MGLIKAAGGAISGTLADQWKEFFYCEALPRDILMVKGEKRITSRSSNTKGNDNIISNGSGIAVADGQAMIIVEQGKVVEYCELPGEYTYDSSTEPSIFAGSFGQSILETIFLAHPDRFPSALLTRTSDLTSTCRSAATAPIPIRLSTRFSSTPTYAAMSPRNSGAGRLTPSSSRNSFPLFSRFFPGFPRSRSARMRWAATFRSFLTPSMPSFRRSGLS